ncbi:hypothetical protein TWF225_006102 [Orbilia oligospora]|nr:hypothetical protein TWF225_006102 [Orbilia oligospora]KAF3238382.1 hypothetical protein TWF128_012038 [Orbilia oligospora]KAF3238383.1 hypothetical protein TWF128_012038 [Orbilia oligospora]KAF3238384.1 hypothetical protein TWF128_012038 [Orbilia oligospora]
MVWCTYITYLPAGGETYSGNPSGLGSPCPSNNKMAWQLKLACLDIDGWSRSMQNVRNSRVLAKGRAQGLLWLAVVHQWRPHHGIERGGLFAGRKGKCHLPRQGPGLSDHGLSSSPGHSNSSSTSASKQASKPCQHDLRIKYGWTFNIENRK